MKKFMILALYLATILYSVFPQQPAFPGAQGFGKYAIGGRYGSVYHVTNLNDSGEGSFRDAISEPNRIIVFDVGGVIEVSSRLIADSCLYIAGQTAPGEGITIYGDGITFSNSNHTICRYIRFRMGVVGTKNKDACGVAHGHDMIFDHVSVSWGRDETFSINWDNKGTEPANITIQNSIIAQGLLTHSAGGLIQTNGGVTLFRNLYVDNGTRSNKVKGINQFVNNLVYNWKDAAYIMGGNSSGQSYANVRHNYFIMGPEAGDNPMSGGNENFHLFAAQNWFDSSLDGKLNGTNIPLEAYDGPPDFENTPFNYPRLPTLPVYKLFRQILPSVGASLPYRDYVDFYVINEVKSLGTEGQLISDESSLPFGAPSEWELWEGNPRKDSDNDGMPDQWERRNYTRMRADDAMSIAPNGYANIENYINSINQRSTQSYLRPPLCAKGEALTDSSITFRWLDYTTGERGFILERSENGRFVPVDSSRSNTDSLVYIGLNPEETDTFRICAFYHHAKSAYSDTIIATSKPLVIEPTDPDTFVPDLTWGGQTNAIWDNATKNWYNNMASSKFAHSAKVLFNDTTDHSQAITISEEVTIDEMFVKSDKDFTFTGQGSIAGTGSVNKTGQGTLTLNDTNTYTGPTVIWEGTINASTLANGGEPSSIGASKNHYFNLVLNGGTLNYTGTSTTTDRNVHLNQNSNISIEKETSTLTLSSGIITGNGSLTKSGKGTLCIYNGIGNNYTGETTIEDGQLTIELNNLTQLDEVLGSSNTVNLAGGSLVMAHGQKSNYETYTFTLNVPENASGILTPYRNCYLKNKVAGSGTLSLNIPYIREYIQGNWEAFTGQLIAQGTGTSEGSQLLLNNTVGLPNTRVYTTGNTKIVCWKDAGTMYLGGLSGDKGTYLAGADKKNNSATMTWVVGGANTNETFHGTINNECSSASYKGTTSIVKEGSGTWRLTSNNVYAGTTTVQEGTLVVNGAHSGTGKVSVDSNATLAGLGRLPGTVEILDYGTLVPGDNSTDTFTLGKLILNDHSVVTLDIDPTNHLSDLILVDSCSLNGTLNLSIHGSLNVGDEFTIISGNFGPDSTFGTIIPETPGDSLAWNYQNGILSVVQQQSVLKTVDQLPHNLTFAPNPVQDICTLPLDQTHVSINMQIFSSSGSLVKTIQQNQCATATANFSGLPAGVYFIKLTLDNGLPTITKMIKTHE